MKSLVSHRAALDSRGSGELRRSLLKGKRSHEPSHGQPTRLGMTNAISSCSAVGCSQAVLCLGTSKTEVHAPDCASQQEGVPVGRCLTGTLLTSS